MPFSPASSMILIVFWTVPWRSSQTGSAWTAPRRTVFDIVLVFMECLKREGRVTMCGGASCVLERRLSLFAAYEVISGEVREYK